MKKLIGDVFLEEENIRLEYYLLETKQSYGLEIQQVQQMQVKMASAFGITSNRSAMLLLARCCIRNNVLADSLTDIVDDYLGDTLMLA